MLRKRKRKKEKNIKELNGNFLIINLREVFLVILKSKLKQSIRKHVSSKKKHLNQALLRNN